MAKPSGSACNLDCTYCFYLEKSALFPEGERFRMSDDVLEAYTRNYIASHPAEAPVVFTWQGGEPTLLGLDFYRRALAFQQTYGRGREIQNTFQTNGTLLDDEWCEFLAQNHFLIGLSLDGPEELHDAYRVTRTRKPTHHKVLAALKCLVRHGVEFNVLACVNRLSARQPLEVYHFLRDEGVRFIQFIPVVERLPKKRFADLGLSLDGPPEEPDSESPTSAVTDWSVDPGDYGTFLTAIFDEWVRHDVGQVFVMNFEWALANYMGQPGAVCHHQPTCGRAVVVEHNGDVYSCDHFVYPDYRLGNLREQPLAEMIDSPQQNAFGQAKLNSLPRQCRECPVLRGCWGGCPKHRFIKTETGEPGLNYLCAGYKHYFTHVVPYLKVFKELIDLGRPAEDILGLKLVFMHRETPAVSSGKK